MISCMSFINRLNYVLSLLFLTCDSHGYSANYISKTIAFHFIVEEMK
jgi:hypothetical protein